jgi:hypothetical protein
VEIPPPPKKKDDGKNGRMGSFMICAYNTDKIKENETGGAAA